MFTVGGSANAYTFSTTVSGTTVYFNKNESRSLINGYKNNPASFYLYRAPEGGAGTVSYTKVNASSLADLEDGETYVIVSTRDNTMYACSNEYTTVSGYTSTRLAGVAVTANGDVIEGSTEVTACEWLYDAATSSFKATSGANAGKYLRVPESSSSAVTFSSSALPTPTPIISFCSAALHTASTSEATIPTAATTAAQRFISTKRRFPPPAAKHPSPTRR